MSLNTEVIPKRTVVTLDNCTKMNFIICLLVSIVVTAAEESVQQFTDANNLFAVSAYKEVLKNADGNLLISPLSAETVLSLVQSGSKGETAEELRNALHLPGDNGKIESSVKSYFDGLESEDYTLQSANKLYIKEGFSINEQFKEVASDVYKAALENIDFDQNVEAAETMNQWVEEQTNDKIHNLINSGDLNNETRAILINALYFKGDWSVPFLLSSTKKGQFYKSANDAVEVDLMGNFNEHRYRWNYHECPDLKAKFLELPLKGEDASMIVVLPNEKEGLSALEDQIERVFIGPHNFTMEQVHIVLPKFKIETQVDLKKVLKSLGVAKAFDADEADLSGIAGQKGDLVINKIEQKAFIDVSEEGVEAAAATYVVVAVLSSASMPPPKTFYVDHPFLFYIKIKDAIAFVGRVTEPKQ